MRVCTVKDVAKKAGVSAMTVSRVLNQTGSVSEATRRKVLDAASELHYYGNSVARSLRVNETKTIGVVLSDSSEMVLSTVLRSIHDVVGLQGYTVITANTDRRKEMERFAIETLMRKHIDGLILVAPLCFDRETTDWLKSLAIPFVILMRSCEDETVDSVMNDNFRGGCTVGEYLCSLGARNFLFLPLHDSLSSKARLEGFYEAMNRRKLSRENCMVCEVSQDPETGYEKTKELLETIRRFDAVVCGCDTVAMGVMRALVDGGVRIPEDIRVIGYDGIEFAKYTVVPLSTIAQPFYQIGSTGAQVLLDRIREPDGPARKIMYEGELVIRRSTE